ncbi:MAG: hypothetical protein AMXMBFR64_04960 [Myxococcales bacterium]
MDEAERDRMLAAIALASVVCGDRMDRHVWAVAVQQLALVRDPRGEVLQRLDEARDALSAPVLVTLSGLTVEGGSL